MTVPFTLDANKLRKISGLSTEPSLREATSFLACLARDSAFLHSRLRPLLEGAQGREGWYVAYRHDAPDGSYSLQVFVWLPQEYGSVLPFGQNLGRDRVRSLRRRERRRP